MVPWDPHRPLGVLATEDLSNHGSVIMSYLFSSFLWHFIYLLAVVYILQCNLAAAAAWRSALTACRRPWPEPRGRSTPNEHHQGWARSSCTWKGLQKLHCEGNPFPDTCTTSQWPPRKQPRAPEQALTQGVLHQQPPTFGADPLLMPHQGTRTRQSCPSARLESLSVFSYVNTKACTCFNLLAGPVGFITGSWGGFSFLLPCSQTSHSRLRWKLWRLCP